MATEQNYLTTTRILSKGQIDVPEKYSKQLRLEPGTTVTLVRVGEGLLVIPESSALDRLSRTVRDAMKRAGLTQKDVLNGLEKSRQEIYQKLYVAKKGNRGTARD